MNLHPRAGRRTQLDLVAAQLRGIDLWTAAHRAEQVAATADGLTREMRLDLSRRSEARLREQRALHARAEAQLDAAGAGFSDRPRLRAVLAHRNAWLRDKVTARLAEHGVTVVGVFEDGADAAGTIVVEQPDLLLVEDRLPTLSGVAVVARARAYAPDTVVAAQVLDATGVAAMVDAGAGAVFTRRIPPVEMADQLVACLAQQQEALALV